MQLNTTPTLCNVQPQNSEYTLEWGREGSGAEGRGGERGKILLNEHHMKSMFLVPRRGAIYKDFIWPGISNS